MAWWCGHGSDFSLTRFGTTDLSFERYDAQLVGELFVAFHGHLAAARGPENRRVRRLHRLSRSPSAPAIAKRI